MTADKVLPWKIEMLHIANSVHSTQVPMNPSTLKTEFDWFKDFFAFIIFPETPK